MYLAAGSSVLLKAEKELGVRASLCEHAILNFLHGALNRTAYSL